MKGRARTVFCCLVLELGALTGLPMRPEAIQDLMQTLNTPKIAQTDPKQDPDGGKSDDDLGRPPSLR